jgi:hypothetical protein
MPALSSAPSKGGAVGGDDVVADLMLEVGMLADLDDAAGVAGELDVAALVVPDDIGFDIGAGEIGRGVHVRAEADHRNVLAVLAGSVA